MTAATFRRSGLLSARQAGARALVRPGLTRAGRELVERVPFDVTKGKKGPQSENIVRV